MPLPNNNAQSILQKAQKIIHNAKYIKRKTKYQLLLLILAACLTLPTGALAQERVQSENFRIQFPNLNSGAGIPASSNFRLDSTIGQTAAGQFSSSGYLVNSGFQYIHQIIPFSFSVSDIAIDFGTLTPQSSSTANSTLTVSSGGAGAYEVKVEENNPLENEQSSQIPDTTCDSSTCDETSADVWTTNSTYGFGFNMSGDDVASDFVNSTYFRQFADASSAESPQVIMSSNNVGSGRSATITYKVNISSTQPSGTYRNIVTFTAIPGF